MSQSDIPRARPATPEEIRQLGGFHEVVRSDPVSFIAGNGPIIVRPEGMSDEDWQAIVEREIEARS